MKKGAINKFLKKLYLPSQYSNFIERDNPSIIKSNDLLMIIDMHSGYKTDFNEKDLKQTLEYQSSKIREATENDAEILFFYFGFTPFFKELISAVTTKQPITLRKPKMDGFDGTSLEKILQLKKPEIIHTMGCYAEACVAHTSISGKIKGYPIVIHRKGILPSTDYGMQNAIRKYKIHKIPLI
ncbi:hypothetical protein COU54_05210 [Candidatus Pacearchaeota archaeon CG10_big_fil_rev_8_21_14_0_10_31_24]|nr:MAG: hypothetical protein COU54_05210 [Candidatus Pacearchaeota archaeon CG10_big_fil_rev_8_21_14_0_10_31_24]